MTKLADMFKDPTKWTQREYARTASGEGCYGGDPRAICWCIAGAIHGFFGQERDEKFAKIQELLGEQPIGEWNDAPGRTAAEVQALCEKAGV